MKILFAVGRYHPNHDGLVAGLLGLGHEVGFLVRVKAPLERHRDGVVVTVLGGGDGAVDDARRPRGFVRSIPHVVAVLRRERPDVVIARNADSASYATYLACRALGIRYLLYVQSRDGYESMSVGRRFRLRLGLWPRHTINTACVTPARDIPGKTFDFVPFAVEAVCAGPIGGPGDGPIRILSVGKLDQARKNLVPLVRHLGPLLRAGGATLTLAGLMGRGSGEAYAALLAEIAAQDVEKHVRIHANLGYLQARDLYAAHDLFVLPSTREPAAISPAEAMASGLPTICGSDNGTNYFIAEGETGFVFPDGDFDAMAARVETLAGDRPELARMGRNARARMEGAFSPKGAASRLIEVVERRFGG